MKIESTHAQLNKPTSATQAFLSNFENFEQLLPKERVTVNESSADHIVFEVQGMATISMKVNERKDNQIAVISEGKNPFDFKMDIFIKEEEEGKSSAYLIFDADVNPFMKMMVEKPLTNFFNALADRLQTLDF